MSSSTGLPPREEVLKVDLQAARGLLDNSLDWRTRVLAFLSEVQPRLGDGVLNSADLKRLYRGAEDYVFINRRWQALLDCQGSEAWQRATPSLVHNPLVRLQTKLVLATALMQHDNYALGIDPFFKQRKLRRLLKTDDPAISGELDAAARHFLDPINRNRLARAVVWHRAEAGKVMDRTEDEIFLDEVIQQSPGYQFFTQQLPERLISEWKTGGHAAITFVTDLLSSTGTTMMNSTSLVVGNTLGLVESRHGYLHDLPAEKKTALRSRLRPMDVLLEKTPFRLTDKSIPGHYGHVAVWVGDEADLKALGVWDDPLVRPHHESIRAGAAIVEALRPGVQINTLDHFLNIDDLLVLRRTALTPEETRAAVLRAFAQIGKEYDFNFDVESDRRIVCSELAYVVFPDVTWPTKAILGRNSISPDQVAIRALNGGPFSPCVIFYDGAEVPDKLPETLDVLLREDMPAFRILHPEFVGRSEKK